MLLYLVDVLKALDQLGGCLLLGPLEEVDEHLRRDVSQVAQPVKVPVSLSSVPIIRSIKM